MDRLAAVCEQIASHNSRLKKIALLAEHLRSLNDEELVLAVRFLSEGPAPEGPANHSLFDIAEQPKLSIGSTVLRAAVQAATGWDTRTLSICHAEVGDTGETASLLLRGISAGQPLTLQRANEIYQELFRARTSTAKRDLLAQTFRTYDPLAIKYFVKVITRGLRIGLMGKMVEEAVARACGVPHEAIRDANNRLGDLAQVARAARRGELTDIAARLFHPMEFMLAKPLERVEDLANPADWVLEDKYDGIRSQVHFSCGHVQIFSRGMDDITAAFPELAESLRQLPGSGLIDGEILAWRDGRALNFNLLQQRLARKKVRATLIIEVPVVYVAYDLLLQGEDLLFEEPYERRRARLRDLLAGRELPLLLSPQHHAETHDDLNRLFTEARQRGNEGLLLKRRTSLYEPGRRTGAWQKLKRPYGTLDVVITSAEQGNGRRATVFSDYTFAVKSGDGFVNVGKAYSGLTDTEVKALTRILRAASTDKFGPVMVVRPKVVLEVAFDGVQKSARHKSGYALRFPRILRWRRDKKPEECDDLARVEALYQASLQ
ncbi:MAG TPA: cisplatin damage response ATP-dependent DNA ligase [Bryobacteraceae bacterium]|nr:cisplatin damage response ATP-dependent DNA ligase [Bryobacteraceae bacterium]